VIDDVKSSIEAEKSLDTDSAVEFSTSDTLVVTFDVTASQTDSANICRTDDACTDRVIDLSSFTHANAHDTPDRVSKDVEKTSSPVAEQNSTASFEVPFHGARWSCDNQLTLYISLQTLN
jgi:hypothetical protein